jgi:hypothetical protein
MNAPPKSSQFATGLGPGEAPTDGLLYGRQDGTWKVCTEEAKADNIVRGRQNGAWVEFPPAAPAVSPGNPTGQIAGPPVNGTATTFMRSDAAPALAPTGVKPGWYTFATVAIDAYGRVTAAQSGTAPPPGSPSQSPPLMDSGLGAMGTSLLYARQDHVHPTDTTRFPVTGGTLQGPLYLAADPTAPLQAATKGYVDQLRTYTITPVSGTYTIGDKDNGTVLELDGPCTIIIPSAMSPKFQRLTMYQMTNDSSVIQGNYHGEYGQQSTAANAIFEAYEIIRCSTGQILFRVGA